MIDRVRRRSPRRSDHALDDPTGAPSSAIRRATWFVAIGLAAYFGASAGVRILAPDAWARAIARWGYPSGLLVVGAAFRLVAAAMLLVPRTRELGAALALAICLGAVLVDARAGYWWGAILSALVCGPAAWLMWIDRCRTTGTSWPERTVTD